MKRDRTNHPRPSSNGAANHEFDLSNVDRGINSLNELPAPDKRRSLAPNSRAQAWRRRLTAGGAAGTLLISAGMATGLIGSGEKSDGSPKSNDGIDKQELLRTVNDIPTKTIVEKDGKLLYHQYAEEGDWDNGTKSGVAEQAEDVAAQAGYAIDVTEQDVQTFNTPGDGIVQNPEDEIIQNNEHLVIEKTIKPPTE